MANKKNISPQRKAEIEKEKAVLRKKFEDMDALEVGTSADLGDRHYAREFKKMYTMLRKGFAVLENQRKLKILTNEEAYNQAVELTNKALPIE